MSQKSLVSTLDRFFLLAGTYAERTDLWLIQTGVSALPDHICYKCGSTEEFEHLRKLFETASHFLYQSIISGRRIAIIKFRKPFRFEEGSLWYLELADQKPDGSQKSSFDHIELYPKSGTLEDLVRSVEEKGFSCSKTVRPHHTTYDIMLHRRFKLRFEAEPIIEKIKRDELT